MNLDAGAMEEFKQRTIQQLKWWVWAAAVLPLSALAAMFFIWVYDLDHWINVVMVTGSTTMFIIAVSWWWWAIRVVRCLLDLWSDTSRGLGEVSTTVKEIRTIIKTEIINNSDK